jgi:DNA-binding MarR family transcriptional regulator
VTAAAPAPAPPVPDAPCLSLGVALEARVTNLWAMLTTGSRSALSRTAAGVLGTLRDDGPLRVTELARREAVAQPTMTMIVTRLRREGLVDSAPDPADARAALLSVTAAGRAALQERVDARAMVLGERLERLDPAQRALIAQALGALDAIVPERPVAT